MRNSLRLVLVLFFLISLLSIGGLYAQADNSVIVAADVQDIITLDPARAYEVTNLTVFHAVYETLINVPADVSRHWSRVWRPVGMSGTTASPTRFTCATV